ncbi:tetratricopeptide repeat protein 28-like isoform X2 [Actinia tenebrosa]|uniref:Tetratricopeptide repeat protein 28-like isoform X2 n=1 Tax=Actinia tenebrosa TaxID=6105 RepID=A0A6P8H7M6_ACTTE|nr:tetratricopeptide repeat protein 28-like isoform X2 [Actinia tenebrosa]
MSKHCNDISTMMNSCVLFVVHSNSIGRHADSLKCLKEILPLAVAIPSHELIVRKYLSITYKELNEFENVVLHAKKWIEIAQTISDKENEIAGHHEMGHAFLFLARYDDAIDCGKKCLTIAQEIDSADGMMMAYTCIIAAYANMQKYDDTILYAHKLLDCAMKNNNQKIMTDVYFELERAHLGLNHYQDAIDFGQKCIEIAREIEDRRVEVDAYLLMGRIYNTLSDYDNAIIYFKKCIEPAITIGDKDAEVHAYSLLGATYYFLKKYEDAFQNFKHCIDIVNRIGRKKNYGARACLCIGDIYKRLEQYNDAVHYYKKCIDMAQETGEKEIEAQGCLGLSSVYHASGDKENIDNVIQYGKKCLDISQEIGDKKTRQEIETQGHHFLARAYMDSFKWNEASQSIDVGMAIATELGNEETEAKFKEDRSLLYGFVGLNDKCDVPSVKELLAVQTCSEDELLQDLDEAVKTGDKKRKVRALMKLYNFYRSKKEYEKTINYLQQFKEMDVDCSLNLFCITAIGNMYHLMGENDMALHSFKQGLPTAESYPDTDHHLSQFYHGFGQLLYNLNRELNLAEHYLREGIRCFEAIFTALGCLDEFKISIFDQYVDSYKLLAILLFKGDQMKEGLLMLDRCRARALKDLMMSNFKMEQEEINDEHLEYSDVLSLFSRNDFSIAFYSLYHFILHKIFIGGGTNLHFSGCPSYHSLQKYVDRSFNEMGVREVVDCENRSLDKEEDIQKERRRCIEEYEELNQATNLDPNTGKSALEVLFDILECDTILSSKQGEVVIIPDGPLYQVPFPALRDPRTGKYLSETNRIRLAPSLATLKHFEDFPTDQTSDGKPLIIGNPLVGKVMMDGEERDDIKDLPGAFKEAEKISKLLNTLPLLGDMATKPAVLERLRQGVSVVHIAAHGSLTKGRIALAPSPEVRATKIPDEEDYMLTMVDVQKAQVRAQLVVLSCCHSGRGEIRAEGVVSMCRAFLASGARAVVASLWAIDDLMMQH